MSDKELTDFAQFEVYEKLESGKNRIAICDSPRVASMIAKTLAAGDPLHDPYYVAPIVTPGSFIEGGGTYTKYQMTVEELA